MAGVGVNFMLALIVKCVGNGIMYKGRDIFKDRGAVYDGFKKNCNKGIGKASRR